MGSKKQTDLTSDTRCFVVEVFVLLVRQIHVKNGIIVEQKLQKQLERSLATVAVDLDVLQMAQLHTQRTGISGIVRERARLNACKRAQNL